MSIKLFHSFVEGQLY